LLPNADQRYEWEESSMLKCPACGTGWIVVGLPKRGTLSCVSCHNQWARPARTRHAPEGQWYDRDLNDSLEPETPGRATTSR